MSSTPRFLRAGAGNQILSTGGCLISSIVLTVKNGPASLSLYNASGTINATLHNRLWFRQPGPASGAGNTLHVYLGETLFSSGMVASLNGAGAIATVNMRNRARP